jgi:hypothetical protein
MIKKHRHKFILEWVDAGTCGLGLLWICECGKCKEIKDKRAPTIEEATIAFRNAYLKMK